MINLLIVICTKNREKILAKCLDSLIREIELTPNAAIRILIVHSRNERCEFYELIEKYKEKLKDNLQAIPQSRKGLPNARNSALPLIKKGEIVLFLDDDVLLEPGYIKKLLDHFNKNHALGGLSGAYQRTPKVIEKLPSLIRKLKSILDRVLIGGEIDRDIGEVYRTALTSTNFELANSIRFVKRLSGCNMAYRQEVIEVVGEFDEEYGSDVAIGEDCDYSFRVYRKGYSLIIDPSMRVYHINVDEPVFPQSTKFFAELGRNTARFFLKFFNNGSNFKFLSFILANLYLTIMFEVAALMYGCPFRGLSYFKGILLGLIINQNRDMSAYSVS